MNAKTKDREYTMVDERDLRAYLPNFLDRSESGESFLITRAGVPIAKMLAPDSADPSRRRALPSRVVWTQNLDSRLDGFAAFIDDDQVGHVGHQAGMMTVWFPRLAEERLYALGVDDRHWNDEPNRLQLLESAKFMIAARLLRSPEYAVGQRVRYAVAVTQYVIEDGCRIARQELAEGEGTITRLPLDGLYSPAAMRYRVRHDGGTATHYVEVGVLKHQIIGVVD